jgi:alpha-beta hydrolase superfamily lysophospholipase
MIGGSGPSDFDESIDVEKPFKDLSIGLALNGIATVRFDKRTFVYHNLPSNITINDEYLTDVNNAIKFAKLLPGVDSTQVFILGHSLGGMLCPLILKKNQTLRGAILLEANARPLEDLIYEQSVHLSKINGDNSSAAALNSLFQTTEAIKRITSMDTGKTYLNIKGSYWLSLNTYKPLTIAKSLKQSPMLIIQGGHDYQVTKTDYDLWQKALFKNKNVTFKFYPLINHALDESIGTFSPDEYFEPANVPLYLCSDVANWIKGVK